MTIEFTNREYMCEHGRQPKGYGRWGFEFEGYEFWATGTLTEAKRACKAYIKEIAPKEKEKQCPGFIYVNIMP